MLQLMFCYSEEMSEKIINNIMNMSLNKFDIKRNFSSKIRKTFQENPRCLIKKIQDISCWRCFYEIFVAKKEFGRDWKFELRLVRMPYLLNVNC